MLVKRQPEPPPTFDHSIQISQWMSALVDADDYERLARFHWRPKRKKKKIYAVRRFVRNGKTCEISMHRSIMHSHPGEEPHHKNHDTLDNRKSNLENVPHNEHPHF